MDLSKAEISGTLEIRVGNETITVEVIGVPRAGQTDSDFDLSTRFTDKNSRPSLDAILSSSGSLRRINAAVNRLLDLGLSYEAMANAVNNDPVYQAKYNQKLTSGGLRSSCTVNNRTPQVSWDTKSSGWKCTGITSDRRGKLIAQILETLVEKFS